MGLHYEANNNDLTELDYIGWIADHIDEYEFHGDTVQIKEKLLDYITKRNTYYSDCKSVYYEFCKKFDNNPYNYRTELLRESEDYIATNLAENYMVPHSEDGLEYQITVGYMRQSNRPVKAEVWNNVLLEGRAKCQALIDIVDSVNSQAKAVIAPFESGMCKAAAPYKKQLLPEAILLLIGWLIMGYSLRNAEWIQLLLRYIKLDIPMKYIFRSLVVLVPNKLMVLCSAALFIVMLMLIGDVFTLFKKIAVQKKMQRVADYSKALDKRNVGLQATKKALSQPIEDEIKKENHVSEIIELVELTKKRFVFKFPSGIKPEQYPTYKSESVGLIKKHISYNLFLMILLYLF